MALAGCQGGGANPPPFSTGSAPPTLATSSQSIGPSGGSVSTTLGTQTVKVIVPSGALSGPATVTVTVYAPTSAPKSLLADKRSVRTVGKDAVLITEFAVAVSGATLIKPLQASLTTPAAVSGSVFRLAGYGTKFDDVDTVTYGGGAATSDLNIAWPRMSLASPTAPGTLYAFYTEPTAEAAASVPTPAVTVATTATNPIGMLGTATFTASEADSNGFPYLDPNFVFALSSGTLGKVDPATGAFTAGPLDGAGTITATDTTAGRGNPHGSAAVSVTSQRPGNLNDSFTFSGTLSSTTQLVNRNATQPQTDTANVSLKTTVTSATVTATPAPAIQTIAHSDETDTYPLQTITTSTDTGYAYSTGSTAGLPANIVPGSVIMTGTQAKDSNGSTYLTLYDVLHGNGLIDVLPETTGSFGPNTAALHYTETDPAKFGRDRVVAANGSYVEQGTDAFGDVQTITVNGDLSASYDARQYSGLRFTMTAPSAPPSNIIYRVFNASGTQLAAFSIPSWIPATMTQPSIETDVDNGSQTYPGACNVPSKYGTAGNQIVQTIKRADPALGNLETQTTTTYLAPRVGPVCIQMTDNVQTFYDYTLQNGFSVLVSGGTVPLELTSLSETLTLQSASTENGTHTTALARSTSSQTRSTSSVAPSGAFAAAAFARARFDHAVREKLGGMRQATYSHNFGSNGVKTL